MSRQHLLYPSSDYFIVDAKMSIMFMWVWEMERQSLGHAVAAKWTSTSAITNYTSVIVIPVGSVPRSQLN